MDNFENLFVKRRTISFLTVDAWVQTFPTTRSLNSVTYYDKILWKPENKYRKRFLKDENSQSPIPAFALFKNSETCMRSFTHFESER